MSDKVDLFGDGEFESISHEMELELLKGSERPRFETFIEEDNFFMKYYNFMKENKGPYPDYYVAGALNLLSIAADKRIYTPIEYGHLYPNVWTFQLGVSSLSHKTIAMRPTKILAHDLSPGCAWPGQFSAVGLFQHVSDMQHGYMLKDECGVLLNNMNQNSEAKNARDFFCELYECDQIDSRVLAISQKKKTENTRNVWVIEDPYGTLSWTTTPGTFQRSTTIADITSGFLYRFIYFNPNYARDVPPLGVMREGFDRGFNKIKKELKAVSNKVIERKHTKMTLSFTATAIWQDWQKRTMKTLTANRDEMRGTLFQRLVTMPLKLGMLYTMGSQEFLTDTYQHGNLPEEYEINDDHIIAAISQVDDYFFVHGYESLKLVGSGTLLNRIERLEAILSQNGGSLPLREAYRSLNCSRKELEDIFDAGLDLRETLKLVKVEGVKKVIYTPNTHSHTCQTS